ncbi:MAG: PD40 domain-containing protein [Muribaculaceae bacterium]|nr:PD40 domain-containing protein [Muribaculaceae bacterium]
MHYQKAIRSSIITIIAGISFLHTNAQQVDYSVVSVPEESGIDFMKITRANDYVCMPGIMRSSEKIEWLTNRVLGIARNGSAIAYLSSRNNTTNIFIKDITRAGSSIQRTNRINVIDFSFSPDCKYLCFSEKRGDYNQIFRTNAEKGYVCRQITSNDMDYSPVFSPDMQQIFFTRLETRGVSVWAHNAENNFLSSYTSGMNPCPLSGEPALLLTRSNSAGQSEIWKVNYETGVEECIVSDPNHNFSTPTVSPDGQYILFVGDSRLSAGDFDYLNTDLFVCRMDGTGFTQLTYHAADDLSPVWSADGRHIYFISQRGDTQGTANVWRMSFNY